MGHSVRYQVEDQDGSRVVREIHKIVVHRFNITGFEDPDIYAAGPIFDWERTDAGQFVMKHAVDKPEWHKQIDPMSLGYRYAIVAELETKKLSEFYLKWGKQ